MNAEISLTYPLVLESSRFLVPTHPLVEKSLKLVFCCLLPGAAVLRFSVRVNDLAFILSLYAYITKSIAATTEKNGIYLCISEDEENV